MTAATEFSRMFDISRDLLCVGSLDGHLMLVNPAFEQTLGYTRDELLEMPIETLVHPEDRDRVQNALGRLAEGDEVVDFETRVVRADGMVRRLEANARPIPEEGSFYAAARDVTDRRRTERDPALPVRGGRARGRDRGRFRARAQPAPGHCRGARPPRLARPDRRSRRRGATADRARPP